MSVVTAPYEVDGQIVGTVGVIGPTRMAYERVIPIVDITAKLLSSAPSSTERAVVRPGGTSGRVTAQRRKTALLLGQSGHPGGADRGGTDALSQGVSLGPAGGGDAAPQWWLPILQWRHPQHPPDEIGGKVRARSGTHGWFAAEDPYRKARQACQGPAGARLAIPTMAACWSIMRCATARPASPRPWIA